MIKSTKSTNKQRYKGERWCKDIGMCTVERWCKDIGMCTVGAACCLAIAVHLEPALGTTSIEAKFVAELPALLKPQ
jgi:hypothetical protein